jgi:DNA-binding NarL/FixJ family response regulator
MRIVIAEDSAVVRAGLTDRGHEVVAAVGNADDLRAAVAEHQPDATVVDVRMPPGYTDEGRRAAIALRRDHPKTGVLVFSQYIETRYAADLLGAAAGGTAAGVGYLLKDRVADVGEFVEALSRVASGAPPSTRRSSHNCSAPVAAPTGCAPSRPESARYSP